jgi:hypothetical protein
LDVSHISLSLSLSLSFFLFFTLFFLGTRSLVNAQNNRDRSRDGPRRDLASGAGQLLGPQQEIDEGGSRSDRNGNGELGATAGRRNSGQRPAEERGAEAAAEELEAAAAGRRRLGDPMKSRTWSRSPSTRASTARKYRSIRGDRRRSRKT